MSTKDQIPFINKLPRQKSLELTMEEIFNNAPKHFKKNWDTYLVNQTIDYSFEESIYFAGLTLDIYNSIKKINRKKMQITFFDLKPKTKFEEISFYDTEKMILISELNKTHYPMGFDELKPKIISEYIETIYETQKEMKLFPPFLENKK